MHGASCTDSPSSSLGEVEAEAEGWDGTRGEPAWAAPEQGWELGSTVPHSCADRFSYRAQFGSHLSSCLLLSLCLQPAWAQGAGGMQRPRAG